MQNLCLKLSLYFTRSYFTALKWPAKTIVGKGGYEEAKEQNGCRSSSLTIATKPK